MIMAKGITVPQYRRWIAGILAAMIGLGPLATPGYAALTLLGDQPLSVQNQSKPNILLTVDDSTSMLYDFLPDKAISKYCRDATGNMNAACGRVDSNVDLSLVGHGKYTTAGYIYEQFGFPFPAYDAGFDTSGPGAGCKLTPFITSSCTGGVDPGPLPGLERYPGPPGPGKSPSADKPYEYWSLWPAPVHNTELNHAYYNPRLDYEPPVKADGTPYPQMNAGNTSGWTHVPADPWAATVKYVDLTQLVTIGLWCNSDWSQGLENDPSYCRTNGVGPSATTSSAASADGDYTYPWAAPGIDPTSGSSTALSIAYAKVNATTHALLAAWTTAKDPKYYYQNDNIIWCDSTSPLWPSYGPLLPQTCTDPAPVSTPQVCEGVIDQTCGGGAAQTCVGTTTQVCNGAVPQTCNSISPQVCNGVTPQTCSGLTPQNCAGVGPQTCTAIAPQTCVGANFPTCDGISSQTCDGAVSQSCGGITPQTCDGTVSQFCNNIVPQTCNNVHAQTCDAVGEVCNLPDPLTCPLVWMPPGCDLCDPDMGECGLCVKVPACPPGVCSLTGGNCASAADCPGARQCSINHNACATTADCAPLAGTCSVDGHGCLVAGDCPNLGECTAGHNACVSNADCPLLAGTCSALHNVCLSAADCTSSGHCTSSSAICTTNADCPNTLGHCSVVPTGCMTAAECPNEGHCSDTSAPCVDSSSCPATAGHCSTDGLACFDDSMCPADGHCSLDMSICHGPGDCTTLPGHCTITGAVCLDDTTCPDANGTCTVTHLACLSDLNCPIVPGACSLDAHSCLLTSDCAPSGQCSTTTAVCHSDGECPTINGVCSSVPTPCATDAACPLISGHCSIDTGTACATDANCPVAGATCSITGESCTGAPFECPRQGGTCSIDHSACSHIFTTHVSDDVFCAPVSTPGKCSIDHNTCTFDGMCPPIPSASNTAVCSDLVRGSLSGPVAVPNGNFETPFIANYQPAPPGASWVWGPGSGIQRYYSDYGAYPSSDLWQTAYIQGAGSFSQTIALSPGSYRVTFQAARRPYSVPAGTYQPIIVSVDGVPLGAPVVPTFDFQFNTFAFGFSIVAAGPHTITFAGTDSSGDKTSFIDLVQITSGTSLLEDANGPGLVCRHNNKAYGVTSADRYNYPDSTFNTPVSAGTGPNACTSSPRYASVPRHYYKTGVEWCDKFIATAGDQWLGYGTPVGGTCQDSADSTHIYPRFYQFGQDPSTDNYTTPAFQRIDLDIIKKATATYTHTWTDDSGDVQTITRAFDGLTPDVSEMTNYANWFAYYRTRLLAVKTTTSLSFSELDAKYRVGFHTLSNNAPNTAGQSDPSKFVNIADFVPAQKSVWFAELFNVTIPLGFETTSLDAMVRIGEYYKNGTHPQLAGSTDPIVLACQKNWHMFFTDGYTNQSGLPTTVYGDQDDIVPVLPVAVPGLVPGAPWPPPYRQDPLGTASNSLSDYSTYYWVTDLRTSGPQSANNVSASTKDPASWQHQNFAAIALGTSGKLPAGSQAVTESQLALGTLQWPRPSPSVFKPDNSGVDDLWHAAINGRGRFVNAQSADEVKLGIGQVLADITGVSGVRAGVGVQNVNFSASANFIYQVSFEPSWGGGLRKLQINPVTGAFVAEAWKAETQLDTQLQVTVLVPTPWFTQRKIVTTNETGTAVPFLWANIGANQRDSLAPGKPAARGQAILEFLRGNRAREGAKLNQLRARNTALGDIADSEPVYVGAPNAPYRDGDDPGYSAFKATFAPRAAQIYAGANDGMLHAFDDTTGNETWAYIPSVLYRGGTAGGDPKTGLGALAYQDGALPPFRHHYYVDGAPKVVDVNVAAHTGGVDWRTVLVEGLGKGGAAYFALDVTDPSAITSEAAAASKVMWEFKPADLGYSYGKPIIMKTHAFNGAWVAILASGYNNPSGVGKLYFVRVSDGTLLKTMTTGVGTAGTPSGLAHPSAYTKDFHNQLAEQVYAGDLLGNFWRFDVSDSNPALWTVGKLATLVDGGGVAQPVTTPPQIEIDLGNKIDRWVFVGTGKLYDDSDLTSTQTQTMYAMRDGTMDSPAPLPGTPLVRGVDPATNMISLVHDVAHEFGLDNKPDKGWFDDLPTGQQIVVAPQAALSILGYIGTSLQTDPCLTGMQATLYARDFATGKSLFDDGGGTPIESVAIPEGGVGLAIVALETATGAAPEVRLVVTTAAKIPPMVFKPKTTALVGDHRMSWRLLGQ
jgi:type IV pilus assembly protein PilY1